MSGYIYLASPYTHPRDEVRVKRYQLASQVAGNLMKKGELILSPIAHGHSLVKHSDMGHTWLHFAALDRLLIASDMCKAVHVLDISGWKSSMGVQAEIEFAESLGKDVDVISPKKAGIENA